MKAETVELLGLFDRDIRYLVPIFQRNYKWNEDDHWGPLWDDIRGVADDILEFGEGPDLPDHFLGAIVCEQQQSFGRDALALHVIDGQQRLTTLQLILAAMRRVCNGRTMDANVEYLDGLIHNKASVVKNRVEHRFKVWPNVADRSGYISAMDAGDNDSRHEDAIIFFTESISLWLDYGDIDDPLDDEDYTPEERMEALITAVIRHLKLKHFDEPKWMANIAHGRHHRERIHLLINYWLSMRTLDEIPAGAIFSSFKDYMARNRLLSDVVAKDLAYYADVFDSLDGFVGNSREWWFFRRLQEMDLITPYPVILYLFGLGEELPWARRCRALVAIESYLIRRLIARDSTRSYGSIFIDVLRAAADGDPIESDIRIIEVLSDRSADADRWPSDDVMRQVVLNTNVYKLKQSRLKMVLEAIERKLVEGGRAESVTLGHNLWIEHLLPQAWQAAQDWSLLEGMGDMTRAIMERDHLIHTIGNLSLTTSRLNIELSNQPWVEKVARLRQSVLNLNAEICNDWPDEWSEDTIHERGAKLGELILDIWPNPQALLALDV